jgi:formylglycine-generating enzyme
LYFMRIVTITLILITLNSVGIIHAARLRVKCDQDGAEIRLNGKSYGLCPNTCIFLKSGKYKLVLRKYLNDNSYYIFQKNIILSEGKNKIVTVDAAMLRVYTEEYYYSATKRTNQLSDQEEYLRLYPNGKYSGLVKHDIDTYWWHEAENQKSIDGYREYLNKYPSGIHQSEARHALEKIEKEILDLACAERAKEEVLKQIKNKVIKIEPAIANSMVRVAGGCFQMGDTFGKGMSDEIPLHEVCLTEFSIGKYEVKQGEWQAIMGSNPSSFSNCGADCPVEEVSWEDVQEFLLRLNLSGTRKYRLPTEAEWEYACRSGGKKEQYCGFDDGFFDGIDRYAWHYEVSDSKTHPVGQKKPNGLGLYDMSGNVWEWVDDLKGDYTAGMQRNPQGPIKGAYRVFRGGGWNFLPTYLRASIRYACTPDHRRSNLGFRLAASVL